MFFRLTKSIQCLGAITLALLVAVLAPLGAHAGWQDKLGTLRIGFAAKDQPAAIAVRMEPFRLAIQEKLSVPVEIIPMSSLSSLVLSHAEGRVEYAIYSAAAYASAWNICECVEPLVVARSSDGSQDVRSVIVTRRNGGPAEVSGLVGKRIIALAKDSVTGYAFALFQLASQGVDLDNGATEFLFYDIAGEAVTKFAEGEGDALIGWTVSTGDSVTGFSRGTLKSLHEKSTGGLSSYDVIWQSDPVPHRVHALRKNLAGEAKVALRELLSGIFEDDPVAYDSAEPVLGGGYAIARHRQFVPLIKFVASPIPGTPGWPGSDDSGKRLNSDTNVGAEKNPTAPTQ